jgi:hypothetical protein
MLYGRKFIKGSNPFLSALKPPKSQGVAGKQHPGFFAPDRKQSNDGQSAG